MIKTGKLQKKKNNKKKTQTNQKKKNWKSIAFNLTQVRGSFENFQTSPIF